MNMHKPHPWPSAPVRKAAHVDPIVLQIVEGTLNSIEAEIEYAIERTARSPMIREAHDYRVGLFDRRCRKLTGRSYSAMPNAVVRDFPLETMRPGDVFFHNDVYESEGGIGHLPDLCVTVPVFSTHSTPPEKNARTSSRNWSHWTSLSVKWKVLRRRCRTVRKKLSVEAGSSIWRATVSAAHCAGIGSQVSGLDEKPNGGVSPFQGIGTRQASRPRSLCPDRSHTGSCSTSSGRSTLGSPNSSPL